MHSRSDRVGGLPLGRVGASSFVQALKQFFRLIETSFNLLRNFNFAGPSTRTGCAAESVEGDGTLGVDVGTLDVNPE
jgi:hypothetical protein